MRLQHPDLIVVEVGVAEQLVEQAASPSRAVFCRARRDEHRALALAQVVAGRLAGDLGVAEDAEQVVAQLEGDAERQAELPQRGELVERARRRGTPPITSGDSTLYFADL